MGPHPVALCSSGVRVRLQAVPVPALLAMVQAAQGQQQPSRAVLNDISAAVLAVFSSVGFLVGGFATPLAPGQAKVRFT